MQRFSEQLGYAFWYTKGKLSGFGLLYWNGFRVKQKPDIIRNHWFLGLLCRH